MTHYRLLKYCLGLAALSSPLLAQDKPTKAEVRLLAFSVATKMPEIYAQDPGAPPEVPSVKGEVKTYLNHQFTAIPLTSRKIAFTSKPERASLTKEGELMGEVTLPPGADSSILLFLPGKAGSKTKFQILPIDDSKKSFPSGTFRVVNLCALPIRLVLEKKTYEFKPGASTLLEDLPTRPDGQMGMKAVVLKDDVWKEISSSTWGHPGEGRSFLLFFQDPATGDVRLKGFDDGGPRAAADTASTN